MIASANPATKRPHLLISGHNTEAPKIISATAPAITSDTVVSGRALGGAVEGARVLAAAPVVDGVVSPFESDTLPKSELAKAHT
jgi:hypothetical protein